MKELHHDCPVCGSSGTSFFLWCRDHTVTGEAFSLFRCNNCLLVFTTEAPDENEIGRYYESDNYISHTDSGNTFSDKIYYAVRKIMLRRKRTLVRKTTNKNSGTLLDIGSGTGHFAAFMKKSGWNVIGIEINERAREYSVKKSGLDAYPPGKLKSLPSGSFDCVTMWHVLEHLRDPGSTLAEIKRLLSPGGRAIIALPNNISFDNFRYRQFWAAYDVPRHLLHFNPVSFAYTAAQAGFDIVNTKSLPFDVFYISYLSEKNRGSKIPFFKGLFYGIIFFLLSLSDKSRSSSLVYVIAPVNKG